MNYPSPKSADNRLPQNRPLADLLGKMEEKMQNIWSVLIKFLSLHRSVLVVPEVFKLSGVFLLKISPCPFLQHTQYNAKLRVY